MRLRWAENERQQRKFIDNGSAFFADRDDRVAPRLAVVVAVERPALRIEGTRGRDRQSQRLAGGLPRGVSVTVCAAGSYVILESATGLPRVPDFFPLPIATRR